MAEYLAKQYRLGRDAGVGFRARVDGSIDAVVHVPQSTEPAMREYLAFASPAEFRSRNIFTEERPLRRAARREGARLTRRPAAPYSNRA